MASSNSTDLRERFSDLLRTSDGSQAETEVDFHRSLSTMAVLLLAVGDVIGTGIFAILGVVEPATGPAVVLWCIVAGPSLAIPSEPCLLPS